VYYAYVIQSISDPGYFYKGHCENLEARLKQHNSGYTASNKHKKPFRIVYFENFENFKDALIREKYFKSAAGRRLLKSKIHFIK
jgi:putative endonuclease